MNEHDELPATVLNLASRKTESRYWDFKLQHHENNAELIHDILCLANAEHDGQRYLIFGVEDQSYELHSITGTPGRKSQADIAGPTPGQRTQILSVQDSRRLPIRSPV